MSTTTEADVLDIVKKLRTTINGLDNCNYLAERTADLKDPLLAAYVERAVTKIEAAAAATAHLLKHIETSQQYKSIVKKYRTPVQEQEEVNE